MDTDPVPEYQGHLHYEDPEGNNESTCQHMTLNQQKLYQPYNLRGKTVKKNLNLQHVRPLGGICWDPQL